MTYQNDIKNGPYSELFNSGTPKIKGMMKNGELDGKVTIYHPNGKVWQEGNYVNGVRIGKWMNYLETGEFEREDNYKNGLLLNPVPEKEVRIPEKEEDKK